MGPVGKLGMALIFVGLLLLRVEDLVYVVAVGTALLWRREARRALQTA